VPCGATATAADGRSPPLAPEPRLPRRRRRWRRIQRVGAGVSGGGRGAEARPWQESRHSSSSGGLGLYPCMADYLWNRSFLVEHSSKKAPF